MKKLIAILVVFTLIAGAVFAETSVGGNLKISTTLLGGDNIRDTQKGDGDAQQSKAAKPYAGQARIWDAHTNITWEGDNAGGMMRLFTGGLSAYPHDWIPDAFVFWWWKPVDQLRIQLGKNPDADWGHAQITGWGFNGEAQGGVAMDKDRELGGSDYINAGAYGNDYNQGWYATAARTAAWWGGFNVLGLGLSIYPVQGLEINWGVPFTSVKTAGRTYGNSSLNVAYAIPDIGTVRVATVLKREESKKFEPDPKDDQFTKPNFHAAFYLAAIDGLGAEFGFALKPVVRNSATIKPEMRLSNKGATKGTYIPYIPFEENYDQIELGLGLRYGITEDIDIKLRVGYINKKTYYQEINDFGVLVTDAMGNPVYKKGGESILGINVLPSYNFGSFTVFLNAGMGWLFKNKDLIPRDGKGGYAIDPRTVPIDPNTQAKKVNYAGELDGGKVYKKIGVDWYLNPYIAVPASSGRFYAGFKLYSLDGGAYDGSEADFTYKGVRVPTYYNGKRVLNWEIPIGWNVYF